MNVVNISPDQECGIILVYKYNKMNYIASTSHK